MSTIDLRSLLSFLLSFLFFLGLLMVFSLVLSLTNEVYFFYFLASIVSSFCSSPISICSSIYIVLFICSEILFKKSLILEAKSQVYSSVFKLFFVKSLIIYFNISALYSVWVYWLTTLQIYFFFDLTTLLLVYSLRPLTSCTILLMTLSLMGSLQILIVPKPL
jgi:hypothetical protein